MRVIIAGSREIPNVLEEVGKAAKASGFTITEVISGTARGVDRAGEEWAAVTECPVRCFPADWEKHGKSAGYKRNVQMAEYADALIAIWDGESRGTKHMINIAKEQGLAVYVHVVTAAGQEG